MSKHTPGPWEAKPEEVGRDYIRVRGTVLGGRYKIANVVHVPNPIHKIHESETEETRANARLIAAAPELLTALRQAVDLLQDCAAMPVATDGFERVIAKAEGK